MHTQGQETLMKKEEGKKEEWLGLYVFPLCVSTALVSDKHG